MIWRRQGRPVRAAQTDVAFLPVRGGPVRDCVGMDEGRSEPLRRVPDGAADLDDVAGLTQDDDGMRRPCGRLPGSRSSADDVRLRPARIP